MIGACIIGISGFGDVHYRDLMREVAGGRLRAVGATVVNQADEPEKCDRLRDVGCKLFEDHVEMLATCAGDADICFIPVGLPYHERMTCAALDAGMHVYVEKPAAPTVQEVDRMIAAEASGERFVAVGYQYMHSDATWRVKRLLLGGELGAIKSIASRNASARRMDYYTRNEWAGCARLGEQWVLDSPFNNANAHYVNLMCFWAGSELGSSAAISSVEAELYRAGPIENVDTVCFRAVTDRGIRLLYAGTHACTGKRGPDVAVVCERGTVLWDGQTVRVGPLACPPE